MAVRNIDTDLIQQSGWFVQDVDAFRAAGARFNELLYMWTADSRQNALVHCFSQSQTNMWMDILDGAPAAGGKVMMADVTEIRQSRLMPELTPSEGGAQPTPHDQEDLGST